MTDITLFGGLLSLLPDASCSFLNFNIKTMMGFFTVASSEWFYVFAAASWFVEFEVCALCNMLLLWPPGAEGACAEGKVPCALLYVHRLWGDPSPIPGAQSCQTLHSRGEECPTGSTNYTRITLINLNEGKTFLCFCFCSKSWRTSG